MTMDEIDFNDAALLAACQAGDALAEVLRFLKEGPAFPSSPFDNEPVAKLAEALLCTIKIELGTDRVLDTDEQEALGQLGEACAKFIEGWVG